MLIIIMNRAGKIKLFYQKYEKTAEDHWGSQKQPMEEHQSLRRISYFAFARLLMVYFDTDGWND